MKFFRIISQQPIFEESQAFLKNVGAFCFKRRDVFLKGHHLFLKDDGLFEKDDRFLDF